MNDEGGKSTMRRMVEEESRASSAMNIATLAAIGIVVTVFIQNRPFVKTSVILMLGALGFLFLGNLICMVFVGPCTRGAKWVLPIVTVLQIFPISAIAGFMAGVFLMIAGGVGHIFLYFWN